MSKKFFDKKGQSTLEYAILVGVIVAGLVGMQFAVKRGYSGKLRASADEMGEAFSPGHTTHTYTTTSTSGSTEDLVAGVTTTSNIKQETLKDGKETVAKEADEKFFSEHTATQ